MRKFNRAIRSQAALTPQPRAGVRVRASVLIVMRMRVRSNAHVARGRPAWPRAFLMPAAPPPLLNPSGYLNRGGVF